MNPLLTDAQREDLLAHLRQARAEDARDLAATRKEQGMEQWNVCLIDRDSSTAVWESGPLDEKTAKQIFDQSEEIGGEFWLGLWRDSTLQARANGPRTRRS